MSTTALRDQPTKLRSAPERWWIMGVALAACALQARTIGPGLWWDDMHHARPWRLSEALGTFAGPFDPLGIEPSYFRPLTVMTFWLDWNVWGFTAWGYHVTNVVLVAAAVTLLYVFLRQLPIPRTAVLAGVLYFCIAPSNVATSTYISERSDALVAIFVLGALCLTGRHYLAPKARNRWVLLGLFVLAVCSKELGVVLPVLCALYWWALHIIRPLGNQAIDPADGVAADAGLARVSVPLQQWRAAATDRLMLRGAVQFLWPAVAAIPAYLVYRFVVLSGDNALPADNAGVNPAKGLVLTLKSALQSTPWELQNRSLPFLLVLIVVGIVAARSRTSIHLVLFATITLVAACIPLAPVGKVEPRLLFMPQIAVALLVAAIASTLVSWINAFRTSLRSATRPTALHTISLVTVLAIACGFVATTAYTFVQAQDMWQPGAAKMLEGDLQLWNDVANRGKYPQRYVEQVEQRLSEAGLLP